MVTVSLTGRPSEAPSHGSSGAAHRRRCPRQSGPRTRTAGLADAACTTLADGTEPLVSRLAFGAERARR